MGDSLRCCFHCFNTICGAKSLGVFEIRRERIPNAAGVRFLQQQLAQGAAML